MIDAKTLMIGNWLLGANGKHFQVDGYGIMTIQEEKSAAKDVSPIELTPKLLEQAGFELEYDGIYAKKYTHPDHNEFGYDWGQTFGWNARYFDRRIKCTYLHELQNIFKVLTGKELEINL